MAPPPKPRPEQLLLDYAERHNILRSDAEYMLRLMFAARAEAVLEERDACAQLAERTGRLHPLFADQQLQQAIAAAIRQRPIP
jgi:hypothetical protein